MAISPKTRQRLEIALSKYPLEWDEPIERIHPHLERDRRVSREEFWRGGPFGADGKLKIGIIGWKSSRSVWRAKWKGEGVPQITAKAFRMAEEGRLTEAIRVLSTLNAVDTRMASAILMFYDPARFTVMDYVAWSSLVHLRLADPFDFWFQSAGDYPLYNLAVHKFAKDFGHNLRDSDRALWVYGKSNGKPELFEP